MHPSTVPSAVNKCGFVLFVDDERYKKRLCTVEVPEERVLRDIVPASLLNRNYEAELGALIFKRDTV